MARYFLKAFLFFLVSSPAYSQGFDWQYSPRLPFKTPVMFIGVGAQYDILKHVGDVNYIEGVYPCATFKNGNGTGYGVSGNVEYWKTGFLALTGGVLYQSVPAAFKADGDALPLADGRVFKTEYEFTSNLRYITIEAGAKYRLFDSHFFGGGALQINTLLSKSTSQTERVISPAEGHFSDGSTERTFNADITGFKRFSVTPQILIGYDFPLGLGVYASPTARAGISLNSISDNASWRKVNLSFGISFLKGL